MDLFSYRINIFIEGPIDTVLGRYLPPLDWVWLPHLPYINIGLIDQFADLLEVALKLCQPCLVPLHHLRQLSVYLVLGSFDVEVGV